MLSPESRHLLTDALRPPAGHTVEVAVGTTYSLNLTALLLAPLTFALQEVDDRDGAVKDPVALLASVRRHAEHTTVFYQGGALAVPSQYQKIFAYVEDTVHAVTAPVPDRLFHPKIWVLRFRHPSGPRQHRMVCLSRNLTFDRSWDTVLQLDEQDPDAPGGIDAGPLAGFLRSLPSLASTPLRSDRRKQIDELAAELEGVAFSVPDPFTAGELLPLGQGEPSDALDDPSGRAVVISPFLDVGFTRRIRHLTNSRCWISRPETFDRVGGEGLAGDELLVLNPQAEFDDGSGGESGSSGLGVLAGLHAKVVVLERGSESTVVTGSANGTTAAWGGNVEFCVALSGPTRSCGVTALLGENGKTPGIRSLLTAYEPPAAGLPEPASEQLDLEIEQWQRELESHLTLTVSPSPSGWELALQLPDIPVLGTSRVAPAALTFDVHAKPWATKTRWHDVLLTSISPFVAVETRLERDGAFASRRCLIAARLIGDPADRKAKLLADFLSSKADLLRLLILLLGDEAAAGAFASSGLESSLRGSSAGATSGDEFPLFELLVRALSRDPSSLEQIARLRQEIEEAPDLISLLPDGFDALWAPIQLVWKERQP